MIEIIAWILLTLTVVMSTSLIAKRYGVEYMISMYVALVVLANILANKIVVFAGWAVPAAVIVYSSSFLITDMLSEFYGKKSAQKAVWAGLMASVVMVFSISIGIAWEPSSMWTNQDAFESVLGNTPRIVFASLIAYLVSQNHDVISYEFWKKRFPQHLWLRNNASTIVSQAIDTVLFITIAFYGMFPIWELIFGQYMVKMIIALMDTPFLYIAGKLRLYQEK